MVIPEPNPTPSAELAVTALTRTPDRTRVTAQLELDPQGAAEQVADKTGLVSHRVKGDLERFREFIEARGQETGAWRGQVDRPQP